MTDYQEKVFNILKYFDWFCKKNNISYCLVGGSVLGAVRHGGFIPWDDDIDVALPREDYNKLLKIIHHMDSPYFGDFPEFDDDFYLNFGKIYDSNTTVIEDNPCQLRRGVWIDVFPIDGAFPPGIMRNLHWKIIKYFKIVNYHKRVGFSLKSKSFLKKIAILSVYALFLPFSKKTMNYLFHKIASIKKIEKSDFVCNYFGRWGTKEFHKIETFFEFSVVKFNGKLYPAPKDKHRYLEALYGDYMKLPPVHQRVSGHDFVFVDLKNGYKKILKSPPLESE